MSPTTAHRSRSENPLGFVTQIWSDLFYRKVLYLCPSFPATNPSLFRETECQHRDISCTYYSVMMHSNAKNRLQNRFYKSSVRDRFFKRSAVTMHLNSKAVRESCLGSFPPFP